MARAEAPTLLLTKLHPPVVPAQTVARERLFARLRDGRGRRLSLVACPAGFGKSTLLAAWREAESGERPDGVGDARRGRQRRRRAVVARLEALGRACPGARASRTLLAMVPAAPLLEVVLPRLVNELVEQARDVVLVLDDFHRAVGRVGARERRLVRRPSPRVGAARAREPDGPGAAARRAAGARGAARAARATSCGSPRPRRREFLNGRLGLELDPADVALLVARTEGWPAGLYLAALSLAGKAGQARAGPRVRRHERARRRLPRRRGARRLRAGAADVHAAHVGARAPVRAALRRGARRSGLGRRAGVARALEPVPRAARRPPPLVPLPSPVRADPAPGAGAARAGRSWRSCTAARTRGTVPPARPTRRSTTRWRRACSTRPRG